MLRAWCVWRCVLGFRCFLGLLVDLELLWIIFILSIIVGQYCSHVKLLRTMFIYTIIVCQYCSHVKLRVVIRVGQVWPIIRVIGIDTRILRQTRSLRGFPWHRAQTTSEERKTRSSTTLFMQDDESKTCAMKHYMHAHFQSPGKMLVSRFKESSDSQNVSQRCVPLNEIRVWHNLLDCYRACALHENQIVYYLPSFTFASLPPFNYILHLQSLDNSPSFRVSNVSTVQTQTHSTRPKALVLFIQSIF